MGHANIRITLDQYGHLLPGAEDEAAGLLDAFLARQVGGESDAEVQRVDVAAPTPSGYSPSPTASRASSRRK
jgi:hypothetical protein